MAKYTITDILDQLDACATAYDFPMLDNGYIYPAGTRLSAYRSTEHWAIIIEVVGLNNRLWDYERFENCLYCFGNCLYEAPGIQNSRLVLPVPEQDDIFDEKGGWCVRLEADYILIRDKRIAIPKDKAMLSANGVEPKNPGTISIVELLRVLYPEYRSLFLATENELRAHIPGDISLILQLEEWRHPDIVDEKPSDLVTFKEIAEVLVSGDATAYKGTSIPNTHWSNWPMGGAL